MTGIGEELRPLLLSRHRNTVGSPLTCYEKTKSRWYRRTMRPRRRTSPRLLHVCTRHRHTLLQTMLLEKLSRTGQATARLLCNHATVIFPPEPQICIHHFPRILCRQRKMPLQFQMDEPKSHPAADSAEGTSAELESLKHNELNFPML